MTLFRGGSKIARGSHPSIICPFFSEICVKIEIIGPCSFKSVRWSHCWNFYGNAKLKATQVVYTIHNTHPEIPTMITQPLTQY